MGAQLQTILYKACKTFCFKLQGLIAFRLSQIVTLSCTFWHYLYKLINVSGIM